MAIINGLRSASEANRRGLLLGLTLSEIMMIILFALLLLFGVVFQEQEKDKAEAISLKEQLAALEKRLAAVPDANAVETLLNAKGALEQQLQAAQTEGETALAAVDNLSETLGRFGVPPNVIDDILQELREAAQAGQEIKHLREQQSALSAETDPIGQQTASLAKQVQDKEQELQAAKKRVAHLTEEVQKLAQDTLDAAQLGQSLAEAGVTPEEVMQIDGKLAAVTQVASDLRKQLDGVMSPAAAEQVLEKVRDAWSNTAMDNKALSEQAKYWKGRWEKDAGEGKKGVTPCWATSGSVDFIFDVALTDAGMIVRKNDVPQWAEDYARLPASEVVFMQEVEQPDFIAATRPLFDYSVSKDCRFFVRLYDETSPTAKLTYQQRRRAVEGHFFILDMKQARFSVMP